MFKYLCLAVLNSTQTLFTWQSVVLKISLIALDSTQILLTMQSVLLKNIQKSNIIHLVVSSIQNQSYYIGI